MVTYKVSTASVVTALLCMANEADAFWRMPCRSRTGLGRMDPIVAPGTISDHSHAIHGGGAFSSSVKATELKNSQCTSCGVTQDKSAYWTPSLHFMYPNGTTVLVPQVGGMLAYYMLNQNSYDGTKTGITAFPDGFQMIAGDMALRNFTGPVPDPPAYSWTAEMKTQFSLGQKALGFNCLNYQRNPEPSLYRHFMPDKQFLDANCADGVRLELMFPSCWNGKDLDSPDHRAHVAYPDFVMTGVCPPGFGTKLPSLFYETIWSTPTFKGVDGQFVLSYGDPTGYGYHGDFMMGWDSVDFLQQAVNQCTNLSGNIQDCPIFDIQSDATASQCTFKEPDELKNDNAAGPRQGLPVGVPIQAGPAQATKYPIVGLDVATTPKSSSAPPPATVPVVPYTPAASASSSGNNLPKPAVTAPSTSVAAASSVPASSSVKTTAGAAASPASNLSSRTISVTSVITATPPATTAMNTDYSHGDGGEDCSTLPIVGTSYITMATEVLEIVIVQTYTTVYEGAAPTSGTGPARKRRHVKDHAMKRQ